MILRKSYHTSVEDFNKNGRLTPLAVLKIFENIGNRQSDKAGDSPFNFDGHTFAWVITEWKIEVTEYPHYTDTIEAETWSEGLTSPLVASRNFLLYKNGEICARGTSRWVRIDLQKGRLCKIEKELIDKYEPDTKVAFEDSKVEKIPVPEAYISEKKIAIRRATLISTITYTISAIWITLLKPSRTKFTNLRILRKSESLTKLP